MNRTSQALTVRPGVLRLWGMALVGCGVTILCSCRGPASGPGEFGPIAGGQYPSLPESAYTGMPAPGQPCPMPMGPTAAPGMPHGIPLPYMAGGPWAPEGTSQPWPAEEYLCDGGDRGLPAEVRPDWEVLGLESEDTIAHFDTLDGETLIEPSNRVCIYSPRFNAVRRVETPVASERAEGWADVASPEVLMGPTNTQRVGTNTQNFQPVLHDRTRLVETFLGEQNGGEVSGAQGLRAFEDGFLPYENLQVIRQGVIDSAEMPFLALGAKAAITWSSDQAVQVILDEQSAMEDVSDVTAPSVYTVNAPPANPRLRVVKVASTPFAEPGDEVAFTIRFDNVGNQPIGNVVVIDNLTTRLEYLPDSAQCSIEASFFTQANEAGSLAVRCEVTEPLEPGEGGILRFRCRVR